MSTVVTPREHRILERWNAIALGQCSGTVQDYSGLFNAFHTIGNPEIKLRLAQLTLLTVGRRTVPADSIRVLLHGLTDGREYRWSKDMPLRLWDKQEKIIAYSLVHPACPGDVLADAVRHSSPQVFSFALINRNLPEEAAVSAALQGLLVWDMMVNRVMPKHPFPETFHYWPAVS